MLRLDEDRHVVEHDLRCAECGMLLEPEYYPERAGAGHPHNIWGWMCKGCRLLYPLKGRGGRDTDAPEGVLVGLQEKGGGQT